MQTFFLEPSPGECVVRFARRAIQSLQPSAKGQRVRASFNGVPLIIGIQDTPAAVASLFDRISTRQAEEWRRSPEGIAYKQKQEAERQRCQESVSVKLRLLPHILSAQGNAPLGQLDGLMGWLYAIAEDADHIGIDWDEAAGVKGGKEWVALQLIAAGYQQDDKLGLPEVAYKDAEILGRYVIGQVINNLRHGLPPHPVSIKFINQYFELRLIDAGKAKRKTARQSENGAQV